MKKFLLIMLCMLIMLTSFISCSNQSEPEYITIKEVQYSTELTELLLHDKDLHNEDIIPLQYMMNLTELYLGYNEINDLTPLSGLTNLTVLSLINNQISDLTPLSNLKNLEVLFLDNNQIIDITPLSNLSSKIWLELRNNQINDWSAVAHIQSVAGRPFNDTNTQEINPLPPDNQKVFDFSVLPEEVFPRGEWTVNQLIGKYGTPKEVTAFYFSEFNIVFVNVDFSDFQVYFLPESADEFSFYFEGLMEENHLLDENDKNILLEILSLGFSDPNILFPYDIKIDKSTKMQIIDLYSADVAYEQIDYISYYYNFFDENGNLPDEHDYLMGYIGYRFNENEVLRQVEVNWHYFDL